MPSTSNTGINTKGQKKSCKIGENASDCNCDHSQNSEWNTNYDTLPITSEGSENEGKFLESLVPSM